MSWLQEATPCPTSAWNDDFLRSLSDRQRDNDFGDENATEIDFTTTFPASSTTTAVNRRTTAIRPKRPGTATGFAVHQDQGSDNLKYEPSNSKRHLPTGDKLSILAQPAQRPLSRVTIAPGDTNIASSDSTTTIGSARQIKPAMNTDLVPQPPLAKNLGHVFSDLDGIVKHPARRGTVYIPTEDTTMPTVWMGVFSPIKDMDEKSVGDHGTALTGIAAQMLKKRGPRKSSVMAPPRRAPLMHALRPPQETTISEDIPGQMTGKENLPPGHELTGKKKSEKTKILGESSQQPRQAPKRSAFDLTKKSRPSSYAPEENLSPTRRYSAQSPHLEGLPKIDNRVKDAISEHDVRGYFASLSINSGEQESMGISRSSGALNKSPKPLSAGKTEKLPTKPTVPKVVWPVVDQTYPILNESIHASSLYDDNWLAHQEIAITQLVNGFLDTSKGFVDIDNFYTVRSQLLAVYQDHSFVLLHKRLQASLLYGPLSMPKEVLTKSSRLAEDLGMKQDFLDLWLATYDLQTLQVCAEVVIGRECCNNPRTSSAAQISACSPQKLVSRQSLSRYLETFLIRNEDAPSTSDNSMPDPAMSGVQRTFLRSLMLIKLLDAAKTSPEPPVTSPLFQPSSAHKTSVCVIQALSHLLNPASGNIIRSLSHLSYSVSHIQHPLSEYNYHITNLAVDLRDGVRLTRLVELVLYSSSSSSSSSSTAPPSHEDWPLSRDLKFPCLSRATKLHNVQIALTALSGIKGVGGGKMVVGEDIKPEHIVDGFRERTVDLLWDVVEMKGEEG